MFVDNGNPVHPGQVELYGNPIEGQAVLLMSTCDSNTVDVQTVQVTLIDYSNGQSLAPTIQSVFDEENNRWITNLTSIPSKLFR